MIFKRERKTAIHPAITANECPSCGAQAGNYCVTYTAGRSTMEGLSTPKPHVCRVYKYEREKKS